MRAFQKIDLRPPRLKQLPQCFNLHSTDSAKNAELGKHAYSEKFLIRLQKLTIALRISSEHSSDFSMFINERSVS